VTASADTIYLAISPTDTVVTPGDEFDLHLRVTQAGKGFNAYDAVIGYDPAALTFIQRPASQQEGSYMRGACGNTFHVFNAAGDSLVINHSLLCQGVSLHGPGTLYNLRFRASNTAQPTQVRIRFVEFYDAGLFARPVVITNATPQIGAPTDVPGTPVRGAYRLEAAPNPFNPSTVLRVEAAMPGLQSLVVRDAAGRVVRRLEAGWFPAGVRLVVWDGRDGRGARAASGVYLVTLEAAAGKASERLVLVK
jgi:hypothetical protein